MQYTQDNKGITKQTNLSAPHAEQEKNTEVEECKIRLHIHSTSNALEREDERASSAVRVEVRGYLPRLSHDAFQSEQGLGNDE